MKCLKSEFYTLRMLPSVFLIAILALFATGIGASLQWALPFLLKIDPPEVGEGAVGEQVQALIDASNPAFSGFQLAALDITGSGQSSGISIFLITMVALSISAASVAFSSGAIVWKVIGSGSRLRWAFSMIAAVLAMVLVVCIAACLFASVIAAIAAQMHGVSLSVPAGDLALTWLRGTIAILSFSAAIIGVVLAVRKVGLAIGIVVGVVMLGVIVGTIGAMAGWDPMSYAWLPTSAVTTAGGQSLAHAVDPWIGIASLMGWAVLSLGIGLSRFARANL
ncbi:hypothetical protein WG915_02730 [Corynebacterium sp. H128]|uniref:hypothetical protein n=1 Tax=Corynebacterium sp. H128 TaxID=3133427 RepID=UPI0030B30CB7